jgi:hypothetical protein
MSEEQFTLLFWILLFIAAALFVIGALIYTLKNGQAGGKSSCPEA